MERDLPRGSLEREKSEESGHILLSVAILRSPGPNRMKTTPLLSLQTRVRTASVPRVVISLLPALADEAVCRALGSYKREVLDCC